MKTKTKWGKQFRMQARTLSSISTAVLLMAGTACSLAAAPGDVDLSFDPGSTINGVPFTLLLQPDAKILIAGGFTTVHGALRGGVARLNADGTTDETFLQGLAGANGSVAGLALQSDGKILLGGGFTIVNGVAHTNLARLNADGSIDNSFLANTSGRTTYGYASSVGWLGVQTDGKIVIAGDFTNVNAAAASCLTRLNADGSPDLSYVGSARGQYRPVIGAFALQPDGKVVIGGYFTNVSGVARTKIARLNVNGSLDSSFVLSPDFDNATGDSFGFSSLALQSDGKILVGGWFRSTGGVVRTLLRLNTDGSWDANFLQGLAGPGNRVFALALQQNSKIVIGGVFGSVNGTPPSNLARLNSDGSLDNSFLPGIACSIYSLVLQGDGKILAGCYPADDTAYLRRLNPDGSLDSTFGNGPRGASDGLESMALQADGKVLIGGRFKSFNERPRGGVARLNVDGSLDETFLENLAGADSFVSGILYQPDGKVLIRGFFNTINGVGRTRLARLNQDGTLDTVFNPQIPNNPEINAFALQSDGKIVIGGSFNIVNGVIRNRIARLKADGALDNSFLDGLSGPDSTVVCLILQGDGKIIIGGYFGLVNGWVRQGLARLNGDGSLDHSFLEIGGASGVRCLAIQSDYKILVGGWFSSVNGVPRTDLARLNADGTLDDTFGNNLPSGNQVNGIIVQPNGQMLLGMDQPPSLIRLNPEGTFDTSFPYGFPGVYGLSCLALQSDRKILVGSYFTSINQTARSFVARLYGLDPSVVCPSIQTPPASRTVALGSTVDLAVTATGSPLSYQWLFNSTTNITGATNVTLRLANVQATSAGAYSVVIGNNCGWVTSAPAILIVTNAAPVIVTDPVSQTTGIGTTVEFSVLAAGTVPLSYQWWFNATNRLPGATSPMLQLTNFTLSQAGAYSVSITNVFGATTSSPALLTVIPELSNCTDSALRAAIAAAGWAKLACDGTISLTNTITVSSDTVVDGAGHQVTISGNRRRVFYVNNNVTLRLINLTIANGGSAEGGAIYNNGGNVSLEGIAFVGNSASSGTASGGAIYNQYGTVRAVNCLFSNNGASAGPLLGGDIGVGHGGAIFNPNGQVTLLNCLFHGNSAVSAFVPGQYGPSESPGAGAGGAIYNAWTLRASSCTFSNNLGLGLSGLSGYDTCFSPTYGRAGGDAQGGAICNLGVAIIDGSLFVSNSVSGGDGGRGGSGPPYFCSQAPAGAGGGFGGVAAGAALLSSGSATLVNCTITGNSAAGGRGGDGGYGGVAGSPRYPILGAGGAGGAGGSALGALTGQFQLTNCTIVLSTSVAGSGGPGGAGNPAGAAGANGVASLGLSSGPNCLSVADLFLGPLADNGGPTLTMALLPGSPAIDAGDNATAPPTDQRGFPRPAGRAADIGAYELEYPPVLRIVPPQGGTIPVQVYGTNGQTFRLLTSPDLSHWTPVATNQIGSEGTMLFYDNSGAASRFYRLMVP